MFYKGYVICFVFYIFEGVVIVYVCIFVSVFGVFVFVCIIIDGV